MADMHAEILYIHDCPNWVETGRRVATGLQAIGRGEVVVRTLASLDDASGTEEQADAVRDDEREGAADDHPDRRSSP